MTTRSNSFAAHEREDAVSRAARIIERDIRRHTERRRTVVLAVSLAAAGTLLLVSGLSVAIAHNGRSKDAKDASTSAAVQATVKSPVVTEEKPTASMSSAPTKTPPVAASKSSKPAVPAPSAPVVKKRVQPAPAPAKKSAEPKTKGIVARKCGPCHSEAQISSGLDLESATSSVDGMIAGKYVTLSASERSAVISALTQK
jgi:hypothetical protein